jgi:hypothetical protein
MQFRSMLSCALAAVLPVGVLAPACSSSTGTQGQLITCTTDPGTGVIERCQPGDGSGTGTCQDIDEDGDGEPHDDGDDDPPPIEATGDGPGGDRGGDDDDRDGDGIEDDHDCDEHPGEDADRADLPYDVRPQLGSTTRPIIDAFAERGGQLPEIVKITMTGSSWRLTELQAGTEFVVTKADCDHPGNRDTGRDRVFITWKNANGPNSTDHLDIRYCH